MPIVALAAEQVEALTRRAKLFSDNWKTGIVKLQAVVRLDLPRSLTWLRLLLVDGFLWHHTTHVRASSPAGTS